MREDEIDPDAHTQLDFDPIDPEPTGRAESLAWGEHVDADADYPYSTDSAPTEAHHSRSNTALVLGAVVLAVAVIICATVVAVLTLTKPRSAPPTAAPPATTVAVTTPPITPSTTVALPPPPVPSSAPQPTTTVASGPTIGDDCNNWGQFATDPVSGQDMLCTGYSDNIGHGASPQWYSAESGAVGPAAGTADAPRVGKRGGSCKGEVSMTMGRSSDDYYVWCIGGGQYDPPGSEPVWTVYSP